MITDNEDDYHNYDQIITENPTVTNSKPENESSEVLENDQDDLAKIHENMTNLDDDSITTKVIENVENIDEKLESTTTVTSLDFDLKPDINEEGVTEPNIDETTTEKPIIEKPEYEDDFDDISMTISNNDVVSTDNPNEEQHIDYDGVADDYEEQTENSIHFPNSSENFPEDNSDNAPEDISDTNSPEDNSGNSSEDNSDNFQEDNSDNSPEDNPYNSAKDNSDNSHEYNFKLGAQLEGAGGALAPLLFLPCTEII